MNAQNTTHTITSCAGTAQVLFENLPVALAGVDCEGTEASITECQKNDNFIGECTNITSSTVLACANSAGGVPPAMSKRESCSSLHVLVLFPVQAQVQKLLIMFSKSVLPDIRMMAVYNHHGLSFP